MSPLAKGLLIFLGGGVGANARYWLSTAMVKSSPVAFPWSTLLINVLGSLIIGVVLARAPKEGAYLLLCVGLLGGFTTFSAFAFEALSLLKRGELGSGLLYMVASSTLCVLAAGIGVLISGGWNTAT